MSDEFASASEMHLVLNAEFWDAYKPTCSCIGLELREDQGLRCATCDRPVIRRARCY